MSTLPVSADQLPAGTFTLHPPVSTLENGWDVADRRHLKLQNQQGMPDSKQFIAN